MNGLTLIIPLIVPIALSVLAIPFGFHVSYAALMAGVIGAAVIPYVLELIYRCSRPNRCDIGHVIVDNVINSITVPINPIPFDATMRVTINEVNCYVTNGQLWRVVGSNDRMIIPLPSQVSKLGSTLDKVWILTTDGSAYHITDTNITPVKIPSNSLIVGMEVLTYRVVFIHQNRKVTCIGNHTCQVVEEAIKLSESCNIEPGIISYYHLSKKNTLYKVGNDVIISKPESVAMNA